MEKEVAGPSETVPERGWARTFASLANPNFRMLWTGSLLSMSAMQMTMVARPWLAYELSGSGAILGLVAAAQGLPMLLISPIGGVAADRLSKRAVLLVSQGMLLFTAAVIAALIFFDFIEVWHLVVLAFIHGCTVPFNHPVRQSYIPALLPKRLMSNGIALHAMARNMDQVLAPSIAGVLLAIDPAVTFLAIVIMHLFSTVFSIRLPKGEPGQAKGRGMFGEIKFGLRYIAGTSVLRTLVGLAFVAVILGYPFQQLLPVFQDVLLISEWQFGLMYSAVGVGALVGSLVLATFARLATRGYPQLLTGVMFGVMLAAFALSPMYLLSLGLLFFLGMASQSYNTMNQTLMMTHSDPALYGRVASVNMMTRSFMPMSVLPMGALVDAFGAPTTLAVSGILLALVVLLIGAAVPSLWRERKPSA